MKKIWFMVIVVGMIQAQEFYYEFGKKVLVTPLADSRAVDGVKYYTKEEGKKIGVRDEIILKCKDNISCKESLVKYKFVSIANLSKSLILVKVKDTKDIFKIAQELYNEDNIEFATPNFIKERKTR